jgi:hypothetical protein
MKSSRAISRVRVELISNVSETVSASIIRAMSLSSSTLMMMEAEQISKMLDNNSILTRLIARQDVIAKKYTAFKII